MDITNKETSCREYVQQLQVIQYPYCIFYRMVPNDGSIAGSIPSTLLNGQHNLNGFASIDDHIQSRLTLPSYATSTNILLQQYPNKSYSKSSRNSPYFEQRAYC